MSEFFGGTQGHYHIDVVTDTAKGKTDVQTPSVPRQGACTDFTQRFAARLMQIIFGGTYRQTKLSSVLIDTRITGTRPARCVVQMPFFFSAFQMLNMSAQDIRNRSSCSTRVPAHLNQFSVKSSREMHWENRDCRFGTSYSRKKHWKRSKRF